MWRLAFVTCTACARIVVSPPPDHGSIECTSHSIAPAIDIALTVVTAVGAAAATGYMFTHFSGPGIATAFYGTILVAAIPFGFYGSEQYGTRSIAACREARRERGD